MSKAGSGCFSGSAENTGLILSLGTGLPYDLGRAYYRATGRILLRGFFGSATVGLDFAIKVTIIKMDSTLVDPEMILQTEKQLFG